MVALRKVIPVIIAAILILQAEIVDLVHSSNIPDSLQLTNVHVLFQASKSGVNMSSLLFQGYYNRAPNDTFPLLQNNFVNGSPALVLAPDEPRAAGLVMAYGLDYNGSGTYVKIVGTYTKEGGSPAVGRGWAIYLFLTESSNYTYANYTYSNYSIPYWVSVLVSPTAANPYPQLGQFASLAIDGPLIFPYSSTPYIVVQYDPSKGIYIYIVNFNTYLANLTIPGLVPPDVTTIYLGPVLSSPPSPGEAVSFSVAFFNGGVLRISVKNLANGDGATLIYHLNFHPSPGEYWTGVGASSYVWASANWAILYWEIGVPTSPPSVSSNMTMTSSSAITSTTTTFTSTTSTTVTTTYTTTTKTSTTTMISPHTGSVSLSSPSSLIITTAVVVTLVVVIAAAVFVVFAKIRKR